MRKFLSFCLGLLAACTLCACSGLGDTSGGGAGETSGTKAQSTATTAPKATEASKEMDTEGDIGDYHLKIVSAKKGKDYSKKDVLIVTYEWTNNSDDSQMFSTAFSAKAFQNGVECNDLTVVEGVDKKKLLSEIKPGATLEVQEAYVLNDDSDVSIEVGPWISLGNESKIVKTFSVK